MLITASPVVIFHDVIISEAEDENEGGASYRASQLALDAIEGDASILASCDCMQDQLDSSQQSRDSPSKNPRRERKSK